VTALKSFQGTVPPDVGRLQAGELLDDLPDYVASRETPETNTEFATKYPSNIISPKSHGFLNSCYANMDQKTKGQGEQFVLIHAHDANARGRSRCKVDSQLWAKILVHS
jgi:anaerobic selenocysteine-containing dehydrogenase